MTGYDPEKEVAEAIARLNARAEELLDRYDPSRIVARFEATRPRTPEELLVETVSQIVADWSDRITLSLQLFPAVIYGTVEQQRVAVRHYEAALAARRARRGYRL